VLYQHPVAYLLGLEGSYLYDGEPAPAHVPGSPPDIWALHQFCIAATNAAFRGNPVGIVWHFRLSP
jgi:hypothetical protein